MKKSMTCLLTAFVMAGCVFGFVFTATAGPGQITPYVEARQEYSDNILFSASNEEEDMISTATAGTILEYKGERTQATLDGRLFHLFYWDNDQLNDTNGSVKGRYNTQLSELVGFGASADYRKDSRRDAAADETGLALTGDREKMDAEVSGAFTLTETSQMELKAGYGMVDIDDIDSIEDDESFSATISFSKNLSKTFDNTVGFINFNFLRYTVEQESFGAVLDTLQDTESNVYQMYMGFSRDITELYNVYLQAGVSYTDSTEEQRLRNRTTGATAIVVPETDSDAVGGVLGAGISYQGLYWQVNLSASHDVRGGSGTSGAVERSSIRADIRRKVTEHISVYLNSSAYLNRNDRSIGSDTDTLTYNVEPGFRFHILDDFSLTIAARYTKKDDREDNTTTERKLAYVMLRKSFDLL